jgi:ATP-dependent Lon protease
VVVSNLKEFLGPQVFHDEVRARVEVPGVVPGLAWTPVGGEILFIESLVVEGRRSNLQLTGQLGDVMTESARIALSLVRSKAKSFGIEPDKINNSEIHIHVPSGSVPKDGPSAGITIAVSIISLLKGKRVKSRMGMTGELTLTGKVLPVGGVRDKILAARRAGLKEVILPSMNRSSVEEVPDYLREGLTFHFVDRFSEVYQRAF